MKRIDIYTMTLKDAALVTGLSIRKLYDLIGTGKIESRKIGKRRLIVAKSLQDFLSKDRPTA